MPPGQVNDFKLGSRMSEDNVIFYQPKLPVDLTRLAIRYGLGCCGGNKRRACIGDYDGEKKLRFQHGLVGGKKVAQKVGQKSACQSSKLERRRRYPGKRLKNDKIVLATMLQASKITYTQFRLRSSCQSWS